MSSRNAYEGTRRKLVLSFDVGTTFSGISYSILEPGQVPTIKGVTKFPGQDTSTGASKIPTVIYYDKLGNIRAVGAEAARDGIDIEAQENGWVKAEWFKLHLPNKRIFEKNPQIEEETAIPPLPPGKRAIDVLADFLRYLHACAAQYIKDTHLNGPSLWGSVEDEISYVLSHPNGWEGSEQSKMREAAFLAGLVPEQTSSRLSFVSEGEASLHFCIHSGILTETHMRDNPGFIVVDAGGGTIDISAYRRKMGEEGLVFEEIAPAKSLFEGSVFVNAYARKFLAGFLEDSFFSADLDHIVDVFGKSCKLKFKTDTEPQFIKFGGTRDNDHPHNIKFGQLRLEGSDVAAFFRPSIDAIVKAVIQQTQSAVCSISHVLFVGGFAANDWLFNRVSETLKEKGTPVRVVRPEGHTNKAVADGAMSFFHDHIVRTRVSRAFFGTTIFVKYDPDNPEHRRRARDMFIDDVDERAYLPRGFSVILPKNTQVSETKVFRTHYRWESATRLDLERITCDICCYRGLNEPKWTDVDPDNHHLLCKITADLPRLLIQTKTKPRGETYYQVICEIVLFFGLTEIKAHIAWTDSEGVEMMGPASVVYDPDFSPQLIDCSL